MICLQKLLNVHVNFVFGQVLDFPCSRLVAPKNARMFFGYGVGLADLEVIREIVFLTAQGDFVHSFLNVELLLFDWVVLLESHVDPVQYVEGEHA